MMYGSFEKHLFGLSRCTICRKGAAHIAPSAAALVQLNIYLAFIDWKILEDIVRHKTLVLFKNLKMAKSKKENEFSAIEELRKAWQKSSDEQILLMKYSPRGHLDPLFKKALNLEIKFRGMVDKNL